MRRFAPVAIGRREHAGAGRQLGDAPQRRRSHGAARHAHVARVPAPVGRRSVGRDSARRRRHRHAGRALAGRQAGAQPLLRRAAEPVRSDAATPTARSPSRSTATRTTWSSRSGEARAKGIPEPPDPSRYTSVKDPTAPFHFAFPDLTGKVVSDTDPQFRGKVVILAIGGSWCPNCHDEAPFLAELYKDYRARGLEIVGLMFENDPDPKVSRPRVQSFIKRYGVAVSDAASPARRSRRRRRRRSPRRCRRSSTSASYPDDDLPRARRPGAQRARRASRARRPAPSTCG